VSDGWKKEIYQYIRFCYGALQLFVNGLDSSQYRFFAAGIQKLVDRWDKFFNEFG